MTITGKTTIHYTDDEDESRSEESESVEEEPIQLIDFGPEIDELRERFIIFEAEIREKTEEAERKQLAKIEKTFEEYENLFMDHNKTIK